MALRSGEGVDLRERLFAERFAVALGTAVAGFFAVASGLLLTVVGAPLLAAVPLLASVIALATTTVARRGRPDLAVLVLAVLVSVPVHGNDVVGDLALAPVGHMMLLTLAVFAMFAASDRAAVVFGVANGLAFCATAAAQLEALGPLAPLWAIGNAGVLLVAMFGAGLLRRHMEEGAAELRERLREVAEVVARAGRIAQGDLSEQVGGTGLVARVLGEMVAGLRGLVVQVQESAEVVGVATRAQMERAEARERGAARQADAVARSRVAAASVAQSATALHQALEALEGRAHAAERRTQRAVEAMAALDLQLERIDAMVGDIGGIARKSETLALNAALEGLRLGAQGRGFAVVAERMQALAEGAGTTVGEMDAMLKGIRTAARSTMERLSEASALASEAAESAGALADVVDAQQQAGGRVLAAMGEVSDVTADVVRDARSARASSQELGALAHRLHTATRQFAA